MSEDALDHKMRRMIYNHIVAHPGVAYSIIKKVFDLTDGTLRYHLNYLESKDEIKSSLEGNNRCYFPVQNVIFNARPAADFETYELNILQERILSAVRHEPGISQKELVAQTGSNRISVSYNIKKLIDYGLVQKTQVGRNTCYEFISNYELRKKIMKRLIMKLLSNEIDEHTFLVLKRKLEL